MKHELADYLNKEPSGTSKKRREGMSKSKALHKAKEVSPHNGLLQHIGSGPHKVSWKEAKKKTYGVHQLGLRDEPRHKTLSGKEVKY